MYPTFLAIHNIFRWLALILLALAFLRALAGWLQKSAWTASDRKLGTFSGIAMDVQLLVGLLLYFAFSPITTMAFSNMAGAMSSSDLRFFVVEHLLLMVLAVVFTHLGSILPRKASQDLQKHKRAALWFGLALLMVLAGIPWFRPLFPAL